MNIAILISKKDEAGQNIKTELERSNILFHEIKKDSIYEDSLDKRIHADFYVFATKHRGKEEKVFSVHAPGNWRKADFGGKDGKVCPTSSKILKIFFQELNKNPLDGWRISMESTHHGPYLEKPCLFIEIGSNKENWKDKTAGKHIAETIKRAIEIVQEKNETKNKNEEFIPVLAIGGPHYCPNFNKIQLNSKYAISHVIPEYSLPLTQEMLDEALNKIQEKVSLVLLDWKGCGKSEERKKLIELIEKNNLKLLKTSEI
jgi:D-aminoacyl-tRNA deacylase